MSIKINRSVRFLLLVFSLVALTGCEKSSSSSKVLRVGFVPAENAQQVIQNAQPIVDILQKRLGMEVQPFVATDYTGVIEALRGNKLDIAFLTPASYVLAKSEANVKVVLKSERKGSPFYYAAIITRADSGIKKLEDLRGKTFAFGDPLSTSANVFPRKMLREHGIDPVRAPLRNRRQQDGRQFVRHFELDKMRAGQGVHRPIRIVLQLVVELGEARGIGGQDVHLLFDTTNAARQPQEG